VTLIPKSPPTIPKRGLVAFAHDIVMAGASFGVSLYLRLGDDITRYASAETFLEAGLVFTAIAAGVFYFMNLYRGVWRYASLNDLVAISRAATLVVLIFLLVMFVWTRLDALPRSLPLINWFVLMALLGGPRFLYRVIKDRRFELRYEAEGRSRIPVLLVGAGDGAELFIRSLARDADTNYQVVGIVSEKTKRVGQHIHGKEVLGTTRELKRVTEKLAQAGDRPQRLVLTKNSLDGALVRELLDEAAELGMTLARLPKLTDFRDGAVDKLEIRPIALEDLLGRPQMALDRPAMEAMIKGRRVLITGAGGSIGSELSRQVSDFGPSELALLDHSEFGLYSIDMEMDDRAPDLPRRAFLADVRDRDRIERVFAEYQPQLVFHAAALKHVPLVEANLFEGAMTNTAGTANIADACIKADVTCMVLISTDKAVNPTNIMGATKRIGEIYCQARDIQRGEDAGTRFVTVRFGNVLGSTGSVVPLFQKQLSAGGPITVTHPDMIRYFMTIHESVELILQASVLGQQGHEQDGKIFVLDMGEPVRIFDLAEQMIRLAGLTPGKDIQIEFTGTRPGEKLFEEMFHDGETLIQTGCEGILLAAPRVVDMDAIAEAIETLRRAAAKADAETAMRIIRTLVPEYEEVENGVSGQKKHTATG